MNYFINHLYQRFFRPGRARLRRNGNILLFTGVICVLGEFAIKLIFDPIYHKAGLGSFYPPLVTIVISILLVILGVFLRIRYYKNWSEIQYELVVKENEKGRNSLTPAERVIVDIWHLEGEINSGGFDLYFTHYDPNDAIAALEVVEAHQTLALLKEACALFPKGRPSPDLKKRYEQMEEMRGPDEDAPDPFDKLDHRFYENLDRIDELTLTYWNKNQKVRARH